MNSFKKDKGLLDADIDHFINNHGKEKSIKKRVIRKYRALESDFSTYKHRFPSDFVHLIGVIYLPEIYEFVKVFEAELKGEIENSNQVEFDLVIQGERVG